MPDFRYVKNQCWTMTDEEIVALNEKILARIKKNREADLQAETISQQTGVPTDIIKKRLKAAEKHQISESVFVKKHLWDLNNKEMAEYAKAAAALKKITNKTYRFYVSVVCEKTGWDEKTAKAKMAEAKAKGISSRKYVQKSVWSKTDSEIDFIARFLKRDKNRVSGNTHNYVEKVSQITGWSIGKTELEVLKAKANCGASYEDYYAFRLYERTPEEQRKFVTLSTFEKMRIKYNSVDESRENFDDKAKFNQNFAHLIERKWFVNRDLTFEQFLEKIEGLDKVIIKPLAATQGIGIEVLKCNLSDEDNKAAYDHIMGLDLSIVEEYIIQHPEMSKYCPTTVNTVRVMTLNDNGKCRLLYSVFRMGKEGVVDNFHAGGVAAGVNVQTGVVETNAVNLNGDIFTHSPATNEPIKGFKIPHWDKIADICEKASLAFETTRLVGWDFAVTEKGAELVEGNPGGSYVVAQLPYVEDGVGLYDIMVGPYLEDFYHQAK
jgi:hypothetical protein